MNALDPIRHAYGDAEGPPPAPGDPGYAEYRLLADTRAALDALPRHRPDAAVLAAVQEATRDAAALVPLRHAYDEAEGEPPAAGEAGHAEYVLLRSTRAALDALPRHRPDAAVLDAVKAMVAARTLLPVKAAYGEAEPPAAADPAYAEYALLRSTREVLDRAPRVRPDADAVAAAVTAAEAARKAPVRSTVPAPRETRPAADRPARPRPVFRRLPAWAGTAAMFAIVAVAGVWMLNQRLPGTAEMTTQDGVAQVQPEEEAATDARRPEAPAPDAEAPSAPTASPERLAAASGGRSSEAAGASHAPQRREAPAPSAAPRAAPVPVEDGPPEALADVAAAREGTDEEAVPVAAWETGEDVRLLSLRLQQIAETSEGLDWGASAVPFGAAEATPGAMMEGVQAVRDDAGPARVEVRMRTDPSVRSSGQQNDR